MLAAVVERDAVDDDRPLVVLLQPVDAAQQRGLAGARGPDDDHHLALLDVEADAAQGVDVAPEVLVNVVDLDDGLHARYLSNFVRRSIQATMRAENRVMIR